MMILLICMIGQSELSISEPPKSCLFVRFWAYRICNTLVLRHPQPPKIIAKNPSLQVEDFLVREFLGNRGKSGVNTIVFTSILTMSERKLTIQKMVRIYLTHSMPKRTLNFRFGIYLLIIESRKYRNMLVLKVHSQRHRFRRQYLNRRLPIHLRRRFRNMRALAKHSQQHRFRRYR